MPTFFDGIQRSFADVAVQPAAAATGDGQIDTVQFLEAASGLTLLFDTLGASFMVVKNDIAGNITKLRTRYDQSPSKSKTLQDLVRAEVAEKQNTASNGLLWLKRALDFTVVSLQRNQTNPTEELSVSFSKSYETTLSKHHNFLIRKVFSVALSACPTRADFYAKLAAGDMAKMLEQFKAWIAALAAQVAIIDAFLHALGIEK
ncbi:glycolipid transfer protein domain-containing protein [Entophlyctis helioformis]|nr:glycolipid transfer protein domain-containing protein [Entophlyctis helioformis]